MIPKYDIILSEKIPNVFGIHLLDGVFQDVFLNVGRIYYDESINKICFDSVVISKPEHITDEMIDSTSFKSVIQLIINEVLDGTD